jgi:hypothetical protein
MRAILAILYFFLIGLIGAIWSIYIGVAGYGPTGEPMLFFEFTNPLQRYALPLMLFSFSSALVAYSALAFKGLVTIDYRNGSKYKKAKTNLIWCGLALPGLIFFTLTICNLGHNRHYVAVFVLVGYTIFLIHNWRIFERAKGEGGT